MTAVAVGPRVLDAGRVVQSTFAVLARDWPAFLALGAVLSLAPRLLARWVVFQPAVLDLGQGSLLGRALLVGGLTLAIEVLPAALLIGVIAARATAGLGRQERPLVACLADAVRRAPMLAVASVLLAAGFVSGMLALAFGLGLGLMAIPLRAYSPQWLLHGDPGVVLGGAVGGTLSAVIFAAGGAALYHELRQLKDAGDAGALAAVFD